MPRHDRHEPASDRRPGPYETRYDVVRGYDVPPPLARRAADRAPAMVAARPESREDSGPYG